MTSGPLQPHGAVLAGGLGRRMEGASKPAALLAGRPLIERPLAALAQVCARVAVVAKAGTALPDLPPGVMRWDEPAEPRHPLTGIVHALERAGGPVLVCAADMPFVSADTLRSLLDGVGDARAAVGRTGDRLQPLLALYTPACLPALRAAPAAAPLTATVGGLDPATVDVPERDAVSVDTPAGLRRAQELVSAGPAGRPGTARRQSGRS